MCESREFDDVVEKVTAFHTTIDSVFINFRLQLLNNQSTSDSTSSSILSLSNFCLRREAKPRRSTSDWSKTPLRLILRDRSLLVNGKRW